MGGEAVRVQIVSDQKECLRSVVSGRANYEDEFYSVRQEWYWCEWHCVLSLYSLCYFECGGFKCSFFNMEYMYFMH